MALPLKREFTAVQHELDSGMIEENVDISSIVRR